MVNGTATFLFNISQAPGTPVQITVERWDHGHNTAVEPQDNTTTTDHSPSDDIQTDTGGTVEDCTIVPTATPTSTAASTSTPTNTFVPTGTPTSTPTLPPTLTSTPIPTATPTVTPSSTSTQTPLPTRTATVTATAPTPAVGVVLTKPQSPHLLAVQAGADLSKGGGHGQFSEALKLFVPAGAVNTSLALHVEMPPLSSLPPGLLTATGQRGSVGLGFIFALSASSANGQPVSQFTGAHPLLLQLLYDPAGLQGVDPATLRISFVDPAGNAWKDLPTTVDTFHHILTARTSHFTLFQARGVTHTQAQLNMAQARLTMLAASGAPRVTILPTSQAAVGGVPLDLMLPQGRRHAPVSLVVTGAPGAQLRAAFTLAGVAITQTLALDAQGYATTGFAPPTALTSSQRLQMAVTVSLGASRYATAGTVTLLSGQSSGPLPPGAPPLWATLASSNVRAQTNHPMLLVQTAPGMVVRAVLAKAGQPLTGLGVTLGTADRRGVLQLRLPLIPRTLLALQTQGKGKTLVLQVVVTVTQRGQSSQQVLALAVGP